MPTKKKKKGTEVEVRSSAEVGAVIDYGADAGDGFQGTSNEDYTIPFINLLQDQSKEIKKAAFKVEGAKEGMFINSASKTLINGCKGFFFIPCAYVRNVVQWKTRDSGGGFVAHHHKKTQLVQEAIERAKSTKKPWKWFSADGGHEFVDTKYFYGFVLETPESKEPLEFVVLAASSTKMKPVGDIMQDMRTRPKAPPLYSNILHITSAAEQRDAGDSFNLRIRRVAVLPPDSPLYIAGREMKALVESGGVKVDFNQSGGATSDEEVTDKVFG